MLREVLSTPISRKPSIFTKLVLLDELLKLVLLDVLLKLVLLDVLLLRFAGIPLAHRAHMLCASGDSLSERLSPFQETALGVLREMLTSLAHSAWCTHDGGVFGTSLDPRTGCDFIDGRLLLSLAAAAEACEECTAETLGLNSDIQKMAAEACPSPRMCACVYVCVFM